MYFLEGERWDLTFSDVRPLQATFLPTSKEKVLVLSRPLQPHHSAWFSVLDVACCLSVFFSLSLCSWQSTNATTERVRYLIISFMEAVVRSKGFETPRTIQLAAQSVHVQHPFVMLSRKSLNHLHLMRDFIGFYAMRRSMRRSMRRGMRRSMRSVFISQRGGQERRANSRNSRNSRWHLQEIRLVMVGHGWSMSIGKCNFEM